MAIFVVSVKTCAVQLRPTKDNYFSTDKQGTGQKGTEHFNRLQALVSTLSTGPVFPSDAIGASDAALILRSCDAAGRLLRPDRAATSMDANILDKALAMGTGKADPGELESTTATAAGVTSHIVLAANTSVAYTVSAAELVGPGYLASGEAGGHNGPRTPLTFNLDV